MINDRILEAQGRDRRDLVRNVIRPASNSIENLIKQYPKLDAFAKIRLLREVDRIQIDFSEGLKTFLLDRIDHVITYTLLTYNDLPPKPLDTETLQRIRWSVLNHIVFDQFHGMNLGMRIDRSVARTFQGIKQDLALQIASKGTVLEAIQSQKKFLLSMGQVSGGSAQMWNERLLIGEELRAYQSAALAFCIMTGITEVRWTTNPSKPTPDICKHLEGTYRIEDVPDYPYPGCTCAIEPIIQ